MLADSRELETEHGKRIFGVLLFQDLALIPLLILTPALSEGGRPQWPQDSRLGGGEGGLAAVRAARFGPPFMRGWFLRVARMRSHEVFTLNVLLATLCSPG